ncbi:putative inactive leucine-rich repeat receptor-like protein kinase [Hibiscus syriacus]|uniref:Inactive leucine-rich repeat receptor-like protein kinase n=1 Tax=Hibiscus syriacus TaxID=106335 RepID=A0A6A2Y9M7_HIBSY|nr:putative inactive leucine-rich repeat receptor-like protein kinase [Hibiscus syriacus]
MDSFVTTLVKLPDLRVLTLELSSVIGLQTLILDENMFSGQLPDWLGSFPVLTVLNLRSNFFNGTLPGSFSMLENLRVLALSNNHFQGELPDLSGLTNLQELDLEDNAFGPQFPQLGNKFVGPFPLSLLSLPSITYLNIAVNKLTGMLFGNSSCNAELKFLDLSSNLLTGNLPSCLSDSKEMVFIYMQNCLTNGKENQHPLTFCQNETLAVGILPQRKTSNLSNVSLAFGITGGIIGGIVVMGLIFIFIRRLNADMTINRPTTSRNGNWSGYISQTMKLGALGLPTYRTFSLEDLEDATNNFDTTAFMGEGSRGKMYRSRLRDGTFVAIRCLKMKESHSTQSFMHHVGLISKLRYRHLASALGHYFECYLDDSSVSRIFLIFEYVPNGTLRSWISEGHAERSLTWPQRISAAIGISKGLQFLHTGIVGHRTAALTKDQSHSSRVNYEDKVDVHDFGVILLEMILGRPSKSRNEVQILKNQLQEVVATDDETRRSIADPEVQTSCSDQSLKTMMEIFVRCLLTDPSERPSVEDVLWNLQFAQVQDAWRGVSRSSSPNGSPSQPAHLHVAFH